MSLNDNQSAVCDGLNIYFVIFFVILYHIDVIEANKSYQIPEDDLKNINMLKSEDIADAVIYLLSTPNSVNVTELSIRPLNSDL
uniref:CSON010221 protein n=1 Tax=Culicoides sonorensis TaxID=179676 RepID=A0A336M1X4_CULSO